MSIFELNLDRPRDLNDQSWRSEWVEGFDRCDHRGVWYRRENLPPSIDLGVNTGLFNSGYFNSPAYANGQRAFYPNRYGNNYFSFGNANDVVSYRTYDDRTVVLGNTVYRGYGDDWRSVVNTRNYVGNPREYASGYDETHRRLGYRSEKYDRYANVPIELLPDDGTATEELNRRELRRIEYENALARTQYQPGLRHSRWMHSVQNEGTAATQQAGNYQRPNWWQG